MMFFSVSLLSMACSQNAGTPSPGSPSFPSTILRRAAYTLSSCDFLILASADCTSLQFSFHLFFSEIVVLFLNLFPV